MNQKEREVLDIIKDDPFISQQELSNKVNLSRSTVANIISGLIKKKYLQGKGYVLNEEIPIVCVGAANVDRKFYVKEDLVHGTSNPIHSTTSIGGVARNISENLGRIGENVSLITACGNDSEWDFIRTISSPFINLDCVHQLSGLSTGSYTAVLDKNGNMEYGFADMDVYDELTPEVLAQNAHLLKRAKCIVADLNISKTSLEFLCAFAKRNELKLILIPVSSPKMNHLPENLHAVDWMIVNKDESEAYFNEQASSEEDLIKLAKKWNEVGVSNVIVTSGIDSIIYSNKEETRSYSVEKSEKVVDVTGAGDSFAAAIVYGWLKEKSIDEIIQLGMINSKKTVETNYTVRQDLDEQQLLTNLEEIK